MEKKECPVCKRMNDDNWPLEVAGSIFDGGCQECWEEQSSDAWWDMLERLGELEEKMALIMPDLN